MYTPINYKLLVQFSIIYSIECLINSFILINVNGRHDEVESIERVMSRDNRFVISYQSLDRVQGVR